VALAARAQQSDKRRLIGVLMGYAESDRTARSEVAALRGGLAKLGWTEGSNLRLELRWGNADPDRIRTLAKELINLRPDVILCQTTLTTGILARETLICAKCGRGLAYSNRTLFPHREYRRGEGWKLEA
jgi:hypothetical protein